MIPHLFVARTYRVESAAIEADGKWNTTKVVVVGDAMNAVNDRGRAEIWSRGN